MTEELPTLEERKTWWLLCYGMTAMTKAIKSCKLIKEHCTDNNHPLFDPLSLAVHVYYCRPFGNNKGVGYLCSDIVPESGKGIHSWLKDFRNGVMAHTDANVRSPAEEPMNDVVFTVKGSITEFSTKGIKAQLVDYDNVSEHCEKMIKIFKSEVMELMTKFRDLVPREEGDHLLSVEDGTPVFIAGYDRIIRSDLNYVVPIGNEK